MTKKLRFPGVRIEIAPQPPQKPVDWLDNKFIPCEDMFAGWDDAREVLYNLIKYSNGWEVSMDRSEGIVGLKLPSRWCSATELHVPVCMDYPSPHREVFMAIYEGFLRDYLPDLQKYIGFKSTGNAGHDLECAIMADIKCRQQFIYEMHGRDIRSELSFRCGLSSLGFDDTYSY